MDCSIIIVSWNVSQLLDECLHSIFSSTLTEDRATFEIIVIDSNSTDDTVEMIRSKYPQVRLTTQTENIGFTQSNNIGLSLANGRYLFLLNPDTIIQSDTLVSMIQYMDSNPDVGIIGPHTLNPDGTHQSSRRRFPTRSTAVFESTWLEKYAPRSIVENYRMTDTPDDGTFEVDWVQGSALMARREVYEQIGGLDEGYVMYWEELDWCKRAKDVGWKVVYLGDAHIIHHGGKSTEQATARTQIHFQQSKLRYFRKYYGNFTAQMLRLFLLAIYAWQLVLEFIKQLLGHKRELRRERVQIYWQVIRSGLKVT